MTPTAKSLREAIEMVHMEITAKEIARTICSELGITEEMVEAVLPGNWAPGLMEPEVHRSRVAAADALSALMEVGNV